MMEKMTGGEGRRELGVWWREQRGNFSIRHLRTPNHPPVSLPLRLRSPPIPLFSLSLPTEPYHLLLRVLMMLSLASESPGPLWQYQPTDAVSRTELRKRVQRYMSQHRGQQSTRQIKRKGTQSQHNRIILCPDSTIRVYEKKVYLHTYKIRFSTRGKWVYSLIEPPSVWW